MRHIPDTHQPFLEFGDPALIARQGHHLFLEANTCSPELFVILKIQQVHSPPVIFIDGEIMSSLRGGCQIRPLHQEKAQNRIFAGPALIKSSLGGERSPAVAAKRNDLSENGVPRPNLLISLSENEQGGLKVERCHIPPLKFTRLDRVLNLVGVKPQGSKL